MHRSSCAATILLLAELGSGLILQSSQFRPALRTSSCSGATRCQGVVCSAEDAQTDDSNELSLEAAFQARLEKEGGATSFKLRTDAARTADSVKDGFKSVADKVSDSTSNLLNAGAGRPASDGLLDDDQWKLTVGFFALLIVFSVGNAVLHSGDSAAVVPQLGGGVDKFTSDGGALQFGRQ